MPELRWILGAAGLILLAALWWWETRRRSRDAAVESVDEDEEPTRRQPILEGTADAVPSRDEDEALPQIRASRRRHSTIDEKPPVVEIPAGVEPELARPPKEEEFVPPDVPYRAMQQELGELPEDLRNLPRDERAEAEQRQPWVRTQPLDRNELMGKAGQADVGGAQDAATGQAEEAETATPEAARQRIVALRLICSEGRWPGRTVLSALEAEGLTFGKYSIYHRERDDGKSIFFVASMVEPGSFDPPAADRQSFPGISLFAVIPGPVDAPTTFDMMLATARRLAERLSGHLQDEQGSSLTAQRVLNLREELVHYEHVSKRLQQR